MKGKMIFDALGGIADEYILDAAELPGGRKALPGRRLTVLLAAALALLLCVGAYAASQGWHRALADYLKAGEEQMSELSGAVAMPEVSTTDAGVRVTVKQTLADRWGVYVVYEVEAPEDFVFEDDMLWGWEALSHEPAQPGTSHTSGSRVLEQGGNRRTVLCWIQGREMCDGKLKLQLAKLCRFSPDFDHPLLIDGEWMLEWDFRFNDSSVTLCENTPAGESGEIVIEELSISPVAVYIRVRDTMCSKNMRPVITFTDGTALDLWERNDVQVNHAGDTYSIRYLFDGVIDLDDVAGVSAGGMEFKIE